MNPVVEVVIAAAWFRLVLIAAFWMRFDAMPWGAF